MFFFWNLSTYFTVVHIWFVLPFSCSIYSLYNKVYIKLRLVLFPFVEATVMGIKREQNKVWSLFHCCNHLKAAVVLKPCQTEILDDGWIGLSNITQTLRVKLWDVLRCRCSSLLQQHMAEKFAKVCSYCSWLEYFIFLALCLYVGVEQLWWDEPGPQVIEPAECVHSFHPRPLMAFIPCTNWKKLYIRTSHLVCRWAFKAFS